MRASVSIAAAGEDGARAEALRDILGRQEMQVSTSRVGGTHVLVALCSRHSAHSSAVLQRLEEAARLALPILPVQLDDASWPHAWRYFMAGIRPVRAAGLTDSELVASTLAAIDVMLGRLDATDSSLAPFDREAARRDLETIERAAAPFRTLKWAERTLVIWLTFSLLSAVAALVVAAVAVVAAPSSSIARMVALLWSLLLTMPATFAAVPVLFWVYASYGNLRALGSYRRYGPLGAVVRVGLLYVFPWLLHRVLSDLFLKGRRPVASGDRAKILAWSGLWPLAMILSVVFSQGGYFEWTGTTLLPIVLGYDATWVVVALLTIDLARTVGRIHRAQRSRAAGDTPVPEAPCDVLVIFAPRDREWTQAACSLLAGQGVRCWIRGSAPAPAGAEDGTELRAALVVFSTETIADEATATTIQTIIDAGVPLIPIAIDDAGATSSAFGGVRWRHWLDASIGRPEHQLPALAAAIRRMAPDPSNALRALTPVVEPARRVLGDWSPRPRPNFVMRAFLRFAVAGAEYVAVFLTALAALAWLSSPLRIRDVSVTTDALIQGQRYLLELEVLLVGAALLVAIPFAGWHFTLRRNRRAVGVTESGMDADSWRRLVWPVASLGVSLSIVLAATLAGWFSVALALVFLSVAVLTVCCEAAQEHIRRMEQRFTRDLDRRLDLVDPLQTSIFEERTRFSVLRLHSRAVVIAACTATFAAVLVNATHQDIAYERVMASLRPLDQQIHGAAMIQVGFVWGPILLTFGYWVHRAWANLDPLGLASHGISAGDAAARVTVPIRSAFQAPSVLTRLCSLERSPGRIPAVIVAWWLCLVVGWTGTILTFVFANARHAGHAPAASVTAGACVALAWLSTYIAYTVRERQIVSMLDILERQHIERTRSRGSHTRTSDGASMRPAVN